jgi:cytoskeletal protein CcmA (bactofilin family)
LKNTRRDPSREQIKAILGEGTSFCGSLKFCGTVRIDGYFEGDIVTNDILIIGETGVVKGSIKAGNVHIFGSMIGEIRANNNVEIKSTAQIIGDIFSPMLTVEEGVKLLGNCSIGQDSVREYKSKLLPVNEQT